MIKTTTREQIYNEFKNEKENEFPKEKFISFNDLKKYYNHKLEQYRNMNKSPSLAIKQYSNNVILVYVELLKELGVKSLNN